MISKEDESLFSLTFKNWPHCSQREQINKRQIKNKSNVFPGTGKESTTTTDKKADIMIGEQEFYLYSYTKKFKYLGSIFTPSIKDNKDIKRRINQACRAFAQAKKVLCNHRLQTKTRIWFYEATAVNLLLLRSECWTITKELKRKLEVCHHRSLRKMAGIIIVFDVK